MEVWVSPACSKCRAATRYLDEAGIKYTVRRYLENPPTVAELSAVLDRLGLEPWDVARTGEPVAKEVDLADVPATPPGALARRHGGISDTDPAADHHRRRRHHRRGRDQESLDRIADAAR